MKLVKFFPLLLLALVALVFSGCQLVKSAEDGAKAAVLTPANQPPPPIPANDNSTAYAIGGILAAAFLSIAGVVTHGAINQSTVQQLGAALGGSAPVSTTTTTSTGVPRTTAALPSTPPASS